MGFINKKPEPRDDENLYERFRQRVLDMKLTEDLETCIDGRSVYAAVVDMDMKTTTVTLICVADGTTSLYYSNGGGQIGLGQADPEIAKATVTFLRDADPVLNRLKKTEECPLPKHGKHRVYLLTRHATYQYEFNHETIREESRETQYLFFLYQNVLTKIGEYNQKDSLKN